MSELPDLQFRSIRYQGLRTGPRLLVLGAVHGNEICGTRAIERLITELESGQLLIRSGRLTLIPVTNPLAYRKRQRVGDRNLNRNLTPTESPVDFEDHVGNWLCPILASHDALLDLHSFHSPGRPFAMLGPQDNDGVLEPFRMARQEEAFALAIGVERYVDGWLDTYARGVARRVQRHGSGGSRSNLLNTDPRYGVGTTEYMRSMGGMAVTLECGQHDDPGAPDVAYRAIRNVLAHLGMTDDGVPLPAEPREALSLYEVIDKDHADDAFAKPWSSFDAVAAGELIGLRADGTACRAHEHGYIVFPNAKAEAGQEWFYLARRSHRV